MKVPKSRHSRIRCYETEREMWPSPASVAPWLWRIALADRGQPFDQVDDGARAHNYIGIKMATPLGAGRISGSQTWELSPIALSFDTQ
jgi:hypothetical protein